MLYNPMRSRSNLELPVTVVKLLRKKRALALRTRRAVPVFRFASRVETGWMNCGDSPGCYIDARYAETMATDEDEPPSLLRNAPRKAGCRHLDDHVQYGGPLDRTARRRPAP